MKKRLSVKRKIPLAPAELYAACFDVSKHQSPSALFTAVKFEKERKLFPMIKDAKTTFVKHSKENKFFMRLILSLASS